MKVSIYKKVHFDASHRLLHYEGKCANLHGHRWTAEVWADGEPDATTGILIDYNVITQIIEKFDHQIILNVADPMTACIERFQRVIATPGDPTSELLAVMIREDLIEYCRIQKIAADIQRVRVWESPTCYAELRSPHSSTGTTDEDR